MIDRDIAQDIDDDTDVDTDTIQPLALDVGSTPVDLARIGLTQMAYIRRAIVEDKPMWCIFSAAGDPLGAANTFDQAWSAVKQHQLEPMRVC